MERDAEPPASSLQSDDSLESCPRKRDRASVSPGQMVGGRYKVHSLLGKGGMSIVYKASHVTLGRPVALKILNRHLQSGGSAAERFQREALAISAMDHPNIVKIFGVGNIDDTPYMSMELLEGESLADLLKREQRLTPERAIPIFCQLLDALAHAHERSIIHRDIKPSNVFICADQSVKLLDFGIAKISNDTADSAQKLTATGEIFGTISYMSPEQCTGGKVDHRSDLYSVACLMYEAVDGKPPFTATSAYALATQHTSGHANATEFIAGELGNVILHGLSKNPDDRPQSAAEFKKLLLEPHLLQKKGSKKKPASMTPKQIALGLSLLAVGTMTAYVAWQHSSQKHQPLAQKASSTHSIAKTPIFETLARLARLANNSNATSPDSIKNAIAEIDELVEIRKCTRLQKYSAYFIKHSLQKRLLLQEAEIIASLDECLPFSLTQDGKPTNETGLVQLTKARILLAAGQIERALETTTECEATFAQAHLQSLELSRLAKGG